MRVIDFRETPLPLLVILYFSLRNLRKVYKDSPIIKEETVIFFFNIFRFLHIFILRGWRIKILSRKTFLFNLVILSALSSLTLVLRIITLF
jgi:hypothetical protein